MSEGVKVGDEITILRNACGRANDYVHQTATVIAIDMAGCTARAKDGEEIALFKEEYAPAKPINLEILRLMRHEGVELRISGSRGGYTAGLNTNRGSASVWLASTEWCSTPEEALNALLTDQSIQPEVEQ